jgi:hypothetical protein
MTFLERDVSFWRQRAEQEDAMAANASAPEAVAVHAALARFYRARLALASSAVPGAQRQR